MIAYDRDGRTMVRGHRLTERGENLLYGALMVGLIVLGSVDWGAFIG